MTEAVTPAAAVELADRVRAVVEGALGRSLDDWPADVALAEFPSATYDSLMQLEVATRLEREFELDTGALDMRDVVTLDAVAARLADLGGAS
ncbi:phosphopantetheine-binding protein [Streptomyces niveus]|uniref:phosphopantetheine-binding protein n=1 Tax=Streptomyces niveus TaxID=193462 RepID=UPI0036D2FD3D